MSENPEQAGDASTKVKTYTLELPSWYKPTARMLPEYTQWATMLSRCRNPKMTKFCDYGGRGIKVCDRWQHGEGGLSGFECFLSDMGRRPTRRHSIDRRDNDGNYEPSNCRWATNKQQANNRRSNRKLTFRGETLSMMDTAAKYGVSYFVLRNRITRGWPVEPAILNPPGQAVHPRRFAVGSQLPQSALTEAEVTEIRKLYSSHDYTMLELANRFGVSPPTICLAVNRQTWKHVP